MPDFQFQTKFSPNFAKNGQICVFDAHCAYPDSFSKFEIFSKNLHFSWFFDENFEKKIFFELKNLMFEVVSRAQKSIPEHFFECSKSPSYHMFISHKKIPALKITVFWPLLSPKIPYFWSPKKVFEIWIYGMRGT